MPEAPRPDDVLAPEALDPALAPFDHLVHGDRPIRLAPGERVTAGRPRLCEITGG